MAEPVLRVDHGDREQIGQSVDVFADFYGSVFREEILERFIQKKTRQNSMMVGLGFFVFIVSLLPAFINFDSIFAKILLILGLAGLVIAGFYIVRIRRARERCERDFDDLLGTEFMRAKGPVSSVFESRVYDDYIEMLSGRETKKASSRSKRFQDIKAVYVSPDLYFFKGLGWIPKNRLSCEDSTVLDKIVEANFADSEHRLILVSKNS
ncbi:MAG: hypothetical protein LBU48_00705 [Coriobacteriales bacterium]|jgi:hypothetical protein|nr:hypothetical protein [Coriobacteriales bacterium]